MSTLPSLHGPANPADIGYPATLPIELALRTSSLRDICDAYGIDRTEWDALRVNPVFVADLTAAVEMVRKEGMSFKLKARMQSEHLLTTSWKMIHAPHDEVPPAVKADLLKFTVRAAGLSEEKASTQAGANGNTLQIQINLN